MVERGRNYAPVGSQSPVAKLTDKKVARIKRLLHEGAGNTALVRKFDIGLSAIKEIKANKRWQHIPMDAR
jgi:hypothetical protein